MLLLASILQDSHPKKVHVKTNRVILTFFEQDTKGPHLRSQSVCWQCKVAESQICDEDKVKWLCKMSTTAGKTIIAFKWICATGLFLFILKKRMATTEFYCKTTFHSWFLLKWWWICCHLVAKHFMAPHLSDKTPLLYFSPPPLIFHFWLTLLCWCLQAWMSSHLSPPHQLLPPLPHSSHFPRQPRLWRNDTAVSRI